MAQDGGTVLRPLPEDPAARRERAQAERVQALLFTRLRPLLILRMVRTTAGPQEGGLALLLPPRAARQLQGALAARVGAELEFDPVRKLAAEVQALLLPVATVLHAASGGLAALHTGGSGMAARAWLYSACHALAMRPPSALQTLVPAPSDGKDGAIWPLARRALDALALATTTQLGGSAEDAEKLRRGCTGAHSPVAASFRSRAVAWLPHARGMLVCPCVQSA